MNRKKALSVWVTVLVIFLASTVLILISRKEQADTNEKTTARTVFEIVSVLETETTAQSIAATESESHPAMAVAATDSTPSAAGNREQPKSQYAYASSYPNVTPAIAANAEPGNYLLCVSRSYSLPAGYSANVNTATCVSGSSILMEVTAAAQYRKMYEAALKDGATLTPYSGYRTTSRQKNNFDNKIAAYVNSGYSRVQAINLASQWILPPGCSEHEAGLAMDIVCASEWFKDTKEFRWLMDHGWEYGFILRYPEDKTEITQIHYEPWHWRYVGVDAAKEIMARKICLEEYLGLV